MICSTRRRRCRRDRAYLKTRNADYAGLRIARMHSRNQLDSLDPRLEVFMNRTSYRKRSGGRGGLRIERRDQRLEMLLDYLRTFEVEVRGIGFDNDRILPIAIA